MYPNRVDNKEPERTPILTPSKYTKFSAKAKFPMNRLIVNPIPVKMETPYKLIQLELFGIWASFNFIDTYENKTTPNCLPTKSPNKIPSGTGFKRELIVNPSNETPAFAKANSGIIPKAT